MLLFFIVGRSFGQNCGPNDFYNPACLITDWCSDVFQELNKLSPCHNDELKNKDRIINNKCCDDSTLSNDISHMFTDRCPTNVNTFHQDVCRTPTPGSTKIKAKKINTCPKNCTTNVRLYEDEYSFYNNELKLASTFKDKDAVDVYPLSSCEAYTCGYENSESSTEGWNKIAKTCMCLKESKRTELIDSMATWRICNRTSLNGNPLNDYCSKPMQFDKTEYDLDGDKIIVNYPELNINKDDENYCFGPSWTENEETLVKMKLFYCNNQKVDCEWDSWSQCSGTCGNRWKTRTKKHEARFGGKECDGTAKQKCVDDESNCCSNTCGDGEITRGNSVQSCCSFDGCPSVEWEDIDGKYYFFGKDKLTFDCAKASCESKKGKLFEPKNETINEKVAEKASKKGLTFGTYDGPWLGFHDKVKEGTFVYSSTKLPIQYGNWFIGEPNDYNSEEDCVQLGQQFVDWYPVNKKYAKLQGNFGWVDRDCNLTSQYICEKELV